MELKIQIISIIFSIVYGAIFGILYNFFYALLYKTIIRYKMLINLLFTIDIFLIYFVIMLYINYGTIRLTFIFLLLISFLIVTKTAKSIRNRVKYVKNKTKM